MWPARPARPRIKASGRIAAFFGGYFAYVGVFSPYLALWLNGRGFSPAEIGVLVSPMQWARVVGPPAWGWMADHAPSAWVPRIVALAALGALASAGLLLWDWAFWQLFLVFCLMSLFLSGQVPIAESLAMQVSRGHLGHYGRIRLWGSVGFVVAVLAGGIWFDAVGIEALPQTLLLLLGMVAASALLLPERESPEPESPKPTDSGLASHSHSHSQPARASAPLLRLPHVRAFLWSSFLMLVAHAPLYSFFSLWLEQQGYTRTEIGALWTLGVVAEIVLFRFQQPIFARIGLARIWRYSYAVAALRFFIIALSGGSLVLLLVAQLLHAITFGVHHTASVALVREWFPPHAQARGQALYTMASYGLGGSLGGILAGLIYEGLGPEWAFAMSAVAAGLGYWVARRA